MTRITQLSRWLWSLLTEPSPCPYKEPQCNSDVMCQKCAEDQAFIGP